MGLSAVKKKKYDLILHLYRETKLDAFAVFFAACEGTDKTWTLMKRLYTRVISLAARRGGEKLTDADVLSLARKMAHGVKDGGNIAFSERVSAETAEVTRRFFRLGNAEERVELLDAALHGEDLAPAPAARQSPPSSP